VFLKKLLSYLLLPFPIALVLILAGTALLLFTARQRAGKVILTLGTVALLVFSTGALAGLYMTPLMGFAPVSTLADVPGTKWIVVLGAGCSKDPRVPATARLNQNGLQRLVEGVRLYRTQPGTKLLLSGGGEGGVIVADVMAQAAQDLGVPRSENPTTPRTRRCWFATLSTGTASCW
jgi:uncharacterized SAM-binding protein YcdF (DUF218 family)